MQYENKILISAILIIGVALVSFNVIGPNISGKVSKGGLPVVSVSPKTVTCNGPTAVVEITVDPQGETIRGQGFIYLPSGANIDTFSFGKESQFTNKRAVNYKINCGAWKGKTLQAAVKTRDGVVYKDSFRLT
ncbi:MAG: hypothetical protein ABIB47_00950 [Candidatus Woesearchaeota archaeon]